MTRVGGGGFAFQVGPGDETELVSFLAKRLGISKKKAKTRLLDERLVFVNRRRVWMARHELKRGDRVDVAGGGRAEDEDGRGLAVRAATRGSIPILHQDEDYVVVDKPPGMPSNGPGSVEVELRRQLGITALAAAHRLDTDTSGCLLLAKTAEAFDGIVALFRTYGVRKEYHAIARGRVDRGARTISVPLDSRRAVTHIRTVSSNEDASHLAVRIETGRTHQIRRHLAEIGYPVVGDKSYGTGDEAGEKELRVGRQMLHAEVLEFKHPRTGVMISAKAGLPRDFTDALKAFGLR